MKSGWRVSEVRHWGLWNWNGTSRIFTFLFLQTSIFLFDSRNTASINEAGMYRTIHVLPLNSAHCLGNFSFLDVYLFVRWGIILVG